MTEDNRDFIYRVDRNDCIVFANTDWYDFARENGVTVLGADVVVGCSLWSFICHAETRHLFEILLKQVRKTGRSVTFPYRCDGPECRRFMELRITRLIHQEIEFHSRILRQEQRPRVRLMEDRGERTEEFLIMCGWCKKVALPGNHWVEVEEAVGTLHLFATPRLPRISHGMCSVCRNAFEKQLAQLG